MIVPVLAFNSNPIQEIDELGKDNVTEVTNSMFAYSGKALLEYGIIPRADRLEAVGIDVNDLIYNLVDNGDSEDFTDEEFEIVKILENSGKLHYQVLDDINYINNLYPLDNLWEDLSSSAMRTIRRMISEYKDNNGDE